MKFYLIFILVLINFFVIAQSNLCIENTDTYNLVLPSQGNASVSKDFNGDGFPDIAVAGQYSLVSVLLSGPGGSFLSPVNYTINGSIPTTIDAADLDNDGVLDIVIGTALSENINFFKGSSNGTFSLAATYSVYCKPWHIKCFDFDADGKTDVAFSTYNVPIYIVGYLKNNSGFNFSNFSSTGLSTQSHQFTVNDFNNDGKKDIAVIEDYKLLVLQSTPSNTFNLIATYTFTDQLASVASGDMNNDANIDIVLGYNSVNKISTLSGLGNGLFNAAVTQTVIGPTMGVCIGDMNNDSQQDIVYTNMSGGYLYKGASSLTYTYMSLSPIFAGGPFPELVDLNNDGNLDLVSCNGAYAMVAAIYGDGNFNLGYKNCTWSTYAARSLLSADFNNDGNKDLAFASSSSSVWVKLGNGANSFSQPINSISGGYTSYDLTNGDFNNDGNQDLALSNYGSGSVEILLGDGLGSFTIAPNILLGTNSPGSIKCADVNNDGNADLIIVGTGNWTIRTYLGQGNGHFTFTSSNNSVSQYPFLYIGDINNDNFIDMLAVAGASYIFYTGQGNGFFNTGTAMSLGAYGCNFATFGDLNNDNKIDLLGFNNQSASVNLFPGNGNGTFSYLTSYTIGQPVTCLAISDINKDSFKDILISNSNSTIYGQGMEILLGDAGLTYTNTIIRNTGRHPLYILADDFNNDSVPEILVANYIDNNISVLQNQTAWAHSVGAATVCAGQTVTLQATNGASQYLWLPNNITTTSNSIIVNSAAAYSVHMISSFSPSCSSISNPVNVIINPLPTITISQPTTSICLGQTTTLTASGANTYTWSTASNNNSITISPVSNTSYTVSGTDANGCINVSSPMAITVFPLPAISVSQSTSAICLGQTVTLTANGASTYTWSIASNSVSVLVSPASNTSYTLSGTDAVGCTNVSTPLTITVYSLPAVSITQSNSLICSGQTTTLSANGAVTYTWNNSSNASFISITPLTNTTYTLIGIDGNGCLNTASLTQSVSLCTSLNNYENSEQHVSVFPNPFTNKITITAGSKVNEVIISNALGQIMERNYPQNMEMEFDLSDYARSIYFVTIIFENRQSVFKIVKQ